MQKTGEDFAGRFSELDYTSLIGKLESGFKGGD